MESCLQRQTSAHRTAPLMTSDVLRLDSVPSPPSKQSGHLAVARGVADLPNQTSPLRRRRLHEPCAPLGAGSMRVRAPNQKRADALHSTLSPRCAVSPVTRSDNGLDRLAKMHRKETTPISSGSVLLVKNLLHMAAPTNRRRRPRAGRSALIVCGPPCDRGKAGSLGR